MKTAQEAVAALIGVKPASIPALIRTTNGTKFTFAGTALGLRFPMPDGEDELLRVGRHIWKATWKTNTDGTITKKAELLSQVGT